MNEFWWYIGLYLLGVFISAVAQLMLKKGGLRKAKYDVFLFIEKKMPRVQNVFVQSKNKIIVMIRRNRDLLAEYLNPLTLLAYFIFIVATFLTILSYTKVPLSMAPILGATEYLFVAVLSRMFLKEKIGFKKGLGLCVIILGILIYSAEKIFVSL